MEVNAPTPDWRKQRILFVDPAIWPRYTRGTADLRTVYAELVKVLHGWGAEVEVLDRSAEPLDIWIRDWGWVEGIFFRYAPDYAMGLYSRGAVLRAQRTLGVRLRAPHRALPLVLDGGNLVHNGSVAIITERVFRDNAHLSRPEFERAIASLGFERVVFIPNEPGDEIGHADGMCRFISERTLLVNDYDGANMRPFGRQLRRVLSTAKLGAELVPFPWFCCDERVDKVPSATGCYMNFLQIARGVVLPSFAHRMDERARELVASLVEGPVAAVDARPLAKLGGVFNCISLTR